MSSRLAATLLLVGCAACTAREACEEQVIGPQEPQGTSLTSAPLQGSALLSAAGEQADLTFRGTLSGLPELWQGDSAILSGEALLSLSLAYQSPPLGSDGSTEMPRVEVTFVPRDPEQLEPDRTIAFPTAEAAAFSSPFFETCSDEVRLNCCVYGARECSLLLAVTLERLDGAPFPPLVVDWSVRTQARVTTCPLGGDTPVLSFEGEAP